MREFRSVARTGKTQVWRIGVEGHKVITEYGELGGKLQRTVDLARAKNNGRSNYVAPEVAAVNQMERQILLKTRMGYSEVGQSVQSFEWDKPLPKNLCFYKPQNDVSPRMGSLIEDGDAWFSRKRDGEMMAVVKTENGVDLYSRRMLRQHDKEQNTDWQWKHRFEHIAAEVEENEDIPARSIILGEIIRDVEGLDDRRYVASVMKSLTPRAIETQFRDGFVSYYVWDIAFWGGKDILTTMSTRARYLLIGSVFDTGTHAIGVEAYTTAALPTTLSGQHKSILEMAKSSARLRGWEGFVAIDPDGVYGDKAYNFRGKADRPGNYCCKVKPSYEDDFIAYFNPPEHGKWGRGKHTGLCGAVSLYQFDSAGTLRYICDCGGGMDDDFRKRYSDNSVYPLVCTVEYAGRTYKSNGEATNSLQFPRIIFVRDDKSPDECVDGRL